MEYVDDIYTLAGIGISDKERMIVVEKEYLQKLVKLLDKTKPRVLGEQRPLRAFFVRVYTDRVGSEWIGSIISGLFVDLPQ